MTALSRLALLSTLLLVFTACSSGGADDEAVERPRDVETAAESATDDAVHGEMHDDHHGASADGGDAAHEGADGARADGEAHTIEVEMSEFAYEPDEIAVPAGEPITFVFHNVGVIDHEVMIGDAHMQEEFASMEGHADHAGGHHGDVLAVTVAPGETAELDVTFDETGQVLLGCHLEGHWEAGMAATVVVA